MIPKLSWHLNYILCKLEDFQSLQVEICPQDSGMLLASTNPQVIFIITSKVVTIIIIFTTFLKFITLLMQISWHVHALVQGRPLHTQEQCCFWHKPLQPLHTIPITEWGSGAWFKSSRFPAGSLSAFNHYHQEPGHLHLQGMLDTVAGTRCIQTVLSCLR